MLLAVNMGNTTISLGLFKGNELLKRWSWQTKQFTRLQVRKLASLRSHKQIEAVVVSSVVPQLNEKLAKAFEKHIQIKPEFFDHRWGIIKLKVDEPEKVGTDRIADAIAGFFIYGGPLLIIDLGTAITFNLVSKKGEFLGGAIAPGLELATKALHEKTALLPKVKLELPKSVIGKNTKEAMQAGVALGFIELVKGLIARFKRQYREDLKIIATGGGGEFFLAHVPAIEVYDPCLALRGLQIAWEMRTFSAANGLGDSRPAPI